MNAARHRHSHIKLRPPRRSPRAIELPARDEALGRSLPTLRHGGGGAFASTALGRQRQTCHSFCSCACAALEQYSDPGTAADRRERASYRHTRQMTASSRSGSETIAAFDLEELSRDRDNLLELQTATSEVLEAIGRCRIRARADLRDRRPSRHPSVPRGCAARSSFTSAIAIDWRCASGGSHAVPVAARRARHPARPWNAGRARGARAPPGLLPDVLADPEYEWTEARRLGRFPNDRRRPDAQRGRGDRRHLALAPRSRSIYGTRDRRRNDVRGSSRDRDPERQPHAAARAAHPRARAIRRRAGRLASCRRGREREPRPPRGALDDRHARSAALRYGRRIDLRVR